MAAYLRGCNDGIWFTGEIKASSPHSRRKLVVCNHHVRRSQVVFSIAQCCSWAAISLLYSTCMSLCWAHHLLQLQHEVQQLLQAGMLMVRKQLLSTCCYREYAIGQSFGKAKPLYPTFPIADSTTAGKLLGKLQMMSATSRIRSASLTEDPPNLYTMLTCPSQWCRTRGHASGEKQLAVNHQSSRCLKLAFRPASLTSIIGYKR